VDPVGNLAVETKVVQAGRVALRALAVVVRADLEGAEEAVVDLVVAEVVSEVRVEGVVQAVNKDAADKPQARNSAMGGVGSNRFVDKRPSLCRILP